MAATCSLPATWPTASTVLKKLSFLRDAKIAQLDSLLTDLPQVDSVEAERNVFQDPEVLEITAQVYQRYCGPGAHRRSRIISGHPQSARDGDL